MSAEVEQARKDGTLAYLRKANSYPQGLELAQGPYRSLPESNQLAGGGRTRNAAQRVARARRFEPTIDDSPSQSAR